MLKLMSKKIFTFGKKYLKFLTDYYSLSVDKISFFIIKNYANALFTVKCARTLNNINYYETSIRKYVSLFTILNVDMMQPQKSQCRLTTVHCADPE